jgi:hypothetical protein
MTAIFGDEIDALAKLSPEEQQILAPWEISRRFAVAIHEAGHAVIGRVPGLQCGAVDIVPIRGVRDGFSRVEDPGNDPATVHATILGCMAAAEAEKLFGCFVVGTDAGDLAYVADLACRPGIRVDHVAMRSTARRLVRDHQNTIKRVAMALLLNNRLTAEAIGRLLDDAGGRAG